MEMELYFKLKILIFIHILTCTNLLSSFILHLYLQQIGERSGPEQSEIISELSQNNIFY